jgi:hypothetical protein
VQRCQQLLPLGGAHPRVKVGGLGVVSAGGEGGGKLWGGAVWGWCSLVCKQEAFGVASAGGKVGGS